MATNPYSNNPMPVPEPLNVRRTNTLLSSWGAAAHDDIGARRAYVSALQNRANAGAETAAATNANATANAQQATQGGGSASSSVPALPKIDTSRYINQYNQYAQKTNATRDAYLKQLENRYTNDQANTNSVYDQAARQNYITYRQNQKNLAGELNSLGIRGGASESAAVRLNNAYGTNVATNDAARGTALAQLAQNYADTTADYNRDVDNQLSQAYATALENQSRYEDEQRELARQEAIRQETLRRELEQQQYERQRYAEQVAREEARYQEEQTRYRQERALEQFSATLERFTTPQQINATLESIDPNDPNAPAMVQLLQMRRAQLSSGSSTSSTGKKK